MTVSSIVISFISFPGSAWERTVPEAPPREATALSLHPAAEFF